MAGLPVQIYGFGPFRLEPAERRLTRHGRPVDLAPKVFDALVLLVEHAGRLVGKDEFHAALWPRAVVADVNLGKIIWAIRKVLAVGGDAAVYIETVPKQGYRMIATVERLAPAQAPPPIPASAPGPTAALQPGGGFLRRGFPAVLYTLGVAALAALAYPFLVTPDPGPGVRDHRPSAAQATVATGTMVLTPIVGLDDGAPAQVLAQLVELLALDLPISESLRVADVGLPGSQTGPGRMLTPAEARATAARMGARWIVSGTAATQPGRDDAIEIDLVVYERDGAMAGSTRLAGDPRDPVAVAVGLGNRLRAVLDVPALTSTLAALRAGVLPRDARQAAGYFRGRAALRALDGVAARSELEPVVAAEADFLPARLALAQAFDLVGAGRTAAAQARDVLKDSGSMTRELRLAAEALLATAEGRPAQAVEGYSALHRHFPDDLDYALAAIHARIATGRLDEAAGEAARLIRAFPEEPRAHLADASVLLHQGDHAAALASADRATGLAHGEPWAVFRAECLRYRAMALTGLGRAQEADEALDQSKGLHLAAGNTVGIGKVDALFGLRARRDGNGHEAERHFRSALAAFAEVDAQAQQALVQLQLAQLELVRGDRPAQRHAVDAALQLARESGDLAIEAAAMQALAEIQLHSGEIDAAVANQRDLVILQRRLGQPKAMGWALLGLGHALYHAGQLQEARQLATQALRLATRDGLPAIAIGAHTLSGLIAQIEQRADDAWAAHSAALEIAAQGDRRQAMVESERELARVALDRGDPATAEGLLDSAARRIGTARDDSANGWLQGLRVRLLVAQHRLPEARAALELAQQHVDPDRDAWSWFPLMLHEAELLVAEGRATHADGVLVRAISRARTLNLGLFVDIATRRREELASRHQARSSGTPAR